MKIHTAKETAGILEHFFYRCFDFRMGCAYRIEWPDLRSITGQPNISDDYIEEINCELYCRNLSLKQYNDVLVVDKLDHLRGIRKIPSRYGQSGERYTHKYMVEKVMNRIKEDNGVLADRQKLPNAGTSSTYKVIVPLR